MNLINILATELEIKPSRVEAVINLINEGNTIPFIARYRKEMTGSLSDEKLRQFDERYRYLVGLEERKKSIVNSLIEQNINDEQLFKAIDETLVMSELEDLYRPYKPKKKTRASIAKARGLEPLATFILNQEHYEKLNDYVNEFIDPKREVNSFEEALNGAKDIIAEMISDNASYRKHIRNVNFSCGLICTKKNDKNYSPIFEMYQDYQEPINKIVAHRILAINRGEKAEALKVTLSTPDDDNINYILNQLLKGENQFKTIIFEAASDAYKRLIKPSIDNEIRNDLTEIAENRSIVTFKSNLKELLLEPPVKNKVVLGFDPAYRTGCKLAIVDANGKVLYTGVIYPTPPQNKIEEAKKVIKEIVTKYKVDLISLGNGTASRESEAFLKKMIDDHEIDCDYIIANEAGASVYSASKLGTEEFPQFDVSLRSAVSLARRVQDPLAELIKIDPKSIGVGQYQHDMNQKHLGEALGGVVEDCVNMVGVDLNNASPSLLSYVSGINSGLAKSIVAYRENNGSFKARDELKKVPKLGDKAFEQCAGFLRISGHYPLDNTAVHPESYNIALELLKELELSLDDLNSEECKKRLESITDYEKLAAKLNIGVPTLKDIVSELTKIGRDPRDLNKKAILRHDVIDIKDLKEGMILEGTVRNIMDFGAFIDIGVHQDGLVHISKIASHYIKHPLEVLHIGQIVRVKVIGVDSANKKISLSIRDV